MSNGTDDLIWEVQDQLQRVEQKVDWLVTKAGGNPDVITGHAVAEPADAQPAEPVTEVPRAA